MHDNLKREEVAMTSYITKSGQSTIIDLAKNVPTYDVKISTSPGREIDLNFGTDTAGSMI